MPNARLRDLSAQTRAYSASPRSLIATVGLCLVLGPPMGGCQPASKPAGSSQAAGHNTTLDQADPFAGLRALAQRQLSSPDARAKVIAPPPGVEPAAVAPLADPLPPDSPATAPLEIALAKFTPAAPPSTPTPAPAPPAQSANPQALHLYISGRSKLLEGQAGKAVTDLEAATRLDPTAPQPWRELGEAQIELGRRTSAMASYQKAITLGVDEPRLLDLLAREAIRSRRFEDAAAFLVQARESKSLADEAGLAPLVDIDLAEALGALGYMTASRDLLTSGLEAPFEGIGQSRMRNELAEVMRRRGELWQRIGDTSCRLGQYDKARIAYANAAQMPTLDPGAVTSRRVFADLRLGHSADAALVVVEDIRESEGRVEDRHMGVITYLARSTDVGPKLGEALEDLSRMAGPQATPTVLNRLARASAAALSGEQARTVLRARLAKSPLDADLITDLLATHPADDVKSTIADCTKLIHGAPLAADSYASQIITRGQSVDAITQALARDHAPASHLLAASLLTRLARPDQAMTCLDGEWSADTLPTALAEQAEAAVANGDWTKAGAAAERVAALTGPEASRALVRALQAMQQSDRALAASAPLVADPAAATVDDLLAAADLALRCGKPDMAERYLTTALSRDRFDERAYASLLSLYSPGGPLTDEAKLTTTARSLRQSIASSHAIQGINAQDLVSRSLWPQAQAQLLAMLAEGNENPDVLNMLVTVWERAASSQPELTAGGEQWLRARLAERPESSALLIALSRVLVAKDRAPEAQALLTSRLQVAPLPELARAKEWVVRKGLDKPDEADRMARARLEKAPRTIDNSIELSELLVAAGEVDEAAQRLTSGLPDQVKLTGEQATRLVAILPKIKPEAIASKGPASLDVALKLFDLIAGRGTMTPQMYLTRINLIATGHPQETDRLIAAIDETLAHHPDLFGKAYDTVIQALGKRPEAGPLIKFLGAAANHVTPPNEALYAVWYSAACAKGDEADIERMVNGPPDTERCESLLKGIMPRDGANIPDTLPERRAEVARYAGDRLTNLGRDELAEKAYRLALKFKPDHPWAANNLGYQLFESGGDFDEAGRLIELAYKQREDLNESPTSIVDSMGWLLYKRDKLKDQVDETGDVTSEGAVTVLLRALDDAKQELVTGVRTAPDGTIMDHAADALWRSGDKEKAKELWLSAESAFKSEEQLLRSIQVPESVRKKVLAQVQAVSAKRSAAEHQQEPAVAPLAAKKNDAKPVTARPAEKQAQPLEPHDVPAIPHRP